MSKDKYSLFIKELIDDNFPELIVRKILVFKTNYLFGAIAGVSYFHFLNLLFVSKKIDILDKEEAKSILAHELAHLSIIYKMSLFEKMRFLNWLFSKKVKSDFERKADLVSIERGYARARVSANEKLLKHKTKEELRNRYSKGYLSNEEIKSYAKKIGKW